MYMCLYIPLSQVRLCRGGRSLSRVVRRPSWTHFLSEEKTEAPPEEVQRHGVPERPRPQRTGTQTILCTWKCVHITPLTLSSSHSSSERMMGVPMQWVAVGRLVTPPPLTKGASPCPGSCTPALWTTPWGGWLTSRSASITWWSASCRQTGSVCTRRSCRNARHEGLHQSSALLKRLKVHF